MRIDRNCGAIGVLGLKFPKMLLRDLHGVMPSLSRVGHLELDRLVQAFFVLNIEDVAGHSASSVGQSDVRREIARHRLLRKRDAFYIFCCVATKNLAYVRKPAISCPVIAEVEMDAPKLEMVVTLCRQAADAMDSQGSFRLRVLMQMLLLELAKERAAQIKPSRGRESG